jgi:hypothetical protein
MRQHRSTDRLSDEIGGADQLIPVHRFDVVRLVATGIGMLRPAGIARIASQTVKPSIPGVSTSSTDIVGHRNGGEGPQRRYPILRLDDLEPDRIESLPMKKPVPSRRRRRA